MIKRLQAFFLSALLILIAANGLAETGTNAAVPAAHSSTEVSSQDLAAWSAPFRNWHYWPDHVIPASPEVPGISNILGTDVPMVFQIPGDSKYHISFVAFEGSGYQSVIADSTDMIHWTNYHLAMSYGGEGEFDHGGRVIGAYLYDSYDLDAPRMLKKKEGKYWTLYGAYPRQGGYELRPGSEGLAWSEDGLNWHRAVDHPVMSINDPDCGKWESSCIYQPWLVESKGRYFNFYNAAKGTVEQSGMAFSSDMTNWIRYPANPVLRNRAGGYDDHFCSDPKVFRDGDHWTMFYFGVGRHGAHIMIAFSKDMVHWVADAEPLYKSGGNPSGLDKQYAHKTSLIYNPANQTYYLFYCATPGLKGTTGGRGIGLLTSKVVR